MRGTCGGTECTCAGHVGRGGTLELGSSVLSIDVVSLSFPCSSLPLPWLEDPPGLGEDGTVISLGCMSNECTERVSKIPSPSTIRLSRKSSWYEPSPSMREQQDNRKRKCRRTDARTVSTLHNATHADATTHRHPSFTCTSMCMHVSVGVGVSLSFFHTYCCSKFRLPTRHRESMRSCRAQSNTLTTQRQCFDQRLLLLAS